MKFPGTNADIVADPHGSTTSHHLPNLAPSFDWSGWDHDPTHVSGDNDERDGFQPATSYSLQGEFQESTQPPVRQYTDAPDLWQAPVNFEWDQWAAFIARFPGEPLDSNIN
jgi:hypothetical protein